jgi:Fe-S-cluster-containing dehydrogenase component
MGTSRHRFRLPVLADGAEVSGAPGDRRPVPADGAGGAGGSGNDPRRLPVLAGPGPGDKSETSEGLTRRGFLGLLGAGAALAACGPPAEGILPYTRQPPEVIPGKATFYATTRMAHGLGMGLLAESHAGRPTKLEGNPEHPASLGATSAGDQASLLDLYDPARGRTLTKNGAPASWDDVVRAVTPAPGDRGRGVAFLLRPTSSPLVAAAVDRVRARLPEARLWFWNPAAGASSAKASRRLFGTPLVPQYRFDRARRIVSLDADFLGADPRAVRFGHDFAAGRRPAAGREPNRLYVIEAEPTITGMVADHRLRARPSEIAGLAAALATALSALDPTLPLPQASPPPGDVPRGRFLRAAARDLLRHRGAALVVAGERQPPEVHVLAHGLTAALGGLAGDGPLAFAPSPLLEAGEHSHDLAFFAQYLRLGGVRTLAILGGDPVAEAPGDLDLEPLVAAVPLSIHLALFPGRTGERTTFRVPGLHYLETWGDARAFDGTLSFVQPLVRPLWGGRDPVELLGLFAGVPRTDLRQALRDLHLPALGEAGFHEALRRGVIPGTAFPPVAPAVPAAAVAAAFDLTRREVPAREFELSFHPDGKLHDGASGGNRWLLELPDPVTRTSWTNVARASPETARRLGAPKAGPQEAPLVEVRRGDARVRLPLLVEDGMPEGVVALALGWGRGAGVAVEPLRSAAAPWFAPGTAAVVHGGGSLRPERPVLVPLAVAQEHQELEGREPILVERTPAQLRDAPRELEHWNRPPPSLYGEGRPERAGPQWGMAIDLATCTGCSACVVACQAENNIPTVGEVNARKGREMHWLRIDRYRLGESDDDLRLLPQPMLCQHCEKAPCEYVCPVNATVHSPDGLNEMVYNRCVGTRFCSNNCPYKVRRFNFLEFHRDERQPLPMIHNPDVTVRARGVMEKCTFCVQRIRRAEIEARVEGREIREGEVRTACQQACPTKAIVFGLVSDPGSEVSRLHADHRAYAALHELGTWPRVRYLAAIRNANEELA